MAIICIMAQSSKRSKLGELLSPELFKALGDANRLGLLTTLAEQSEPASVGELRSCCRVDLSVVSRHLAILRNAGVLEADRRGKRVFYRARTRALARRLRGIADALERCCCTEEEGT